ncbi:MAG: hypothetical protein GX607_04315 [Myxococcales bacterium]|jgi:hypothetical protein|nr:hypothetical protein [Myxococcales bacterium]
MHPSGLRALRSPSVAVGNGSPTSRADATRAATLVVIEFSASWPRWLKPTRGGDMAVVAQHYEGHPSSLVTQVASRTLRLEAVGWRLDATVLVSNGRTDPDSVASRAVLARGLAARLKARGRGALVLTVDERAGRRAAHNLLALAEALASSVRGADVSLCVRVGDELSTIAAPPEADAVVSRAG